MADTATKMLRIDRMKVEKKRREIATKISRLENEDAKLQEELDGIDAGIKKLEEL